MNDCVAKLLQRTAFDIGWHAQDALRRLHRCRPFIREVRIKKDYSDYEDVAYCEYNIEFVDSNKGCVCTCMLGTALLVAALLACAAQDG